MRRLAAVARDEFIVRPAVVERVILSAGVFASPAIEHVTGKAWRSCIRARLARRLRAVLRYVPHPLLMVIQGRARSASEGRSPIECEGNFITDFIRDFNRLVQCFWALDEVG